MKLKFTTKANLFSFFDDFGEQQSFIVTNDAKKI